MPWATTKPYPVCGFWRPAESPHVALAFPHGKMSFVSHPRLVTTALGRGGGGRNGSLGGGLDRPLGRGTGSSAARRLQKRPTVWEAGAPPALVGDPPRALARRIFARTGWSTRAAPVDPRPAPARAPVA